MRALNRCQIPLTVAWSGASKTMRRKAAAPLRRMQRENMVIPVGAPEIARAVSAFNLGEAPHIRCRTGGAGNVRQLHLDAAHSGDGHHDEALRLVCYTVGKHGRDPLS